MELPAYVLAGGQSTRFGADKARASLGECPLILRVAETLSTMVGNVTVVAGRAGEYEDLGLPTIADGVPGAGPLEGLLTALGHRRERGGEGWLLLAACDLVEVRAEWLAPLRAAAGEGGAAVAFRTDRWQPLFALYHTSIEPMVRRRREAGENALWRLLEEAGATAVEFPGGSGGPAQVNTPGELDAHRTREEGE